MDSNFFRTIDWFRFKHHHLCFGSFFKRKKEFRVRSINCYIKNYIRMRTRIKWDCHFHFRRKYFAFLELHNNITKKCRNFRKIKIKTERNWNWKSLKTLNNTNSILTNWLIFIGEFRIKTIDLLLEKRLTKQIQVYPG